MSLIDVNKLSFGYDGSYDMVFEDVSFQIDTNWKLGFIGRNGRGKTTFLNLLLGKYEYKGKIHASVNFEYFPYHVNDKSRETLEILQEICPEVMEWEISCELAQLDVEDEVLYRPFETLSNGEQTKVLLAALFLASNAFLLIDEPTNHLDSAARDSVKKYLKRKKGFILVSHDRVLLDECIDHVLSINKTNIEIQKGNFSSWYHNKEQQDKFELAQNEKLNKDIKRLSEASKRSGEWSGRVEKSKKGTTNSGSKIDRGYVGHKAAKMMKRSKSLESRQQTAIREKTKLLKDIEVCSDLELRPIHHHSRRLIELSSIAISYDDKEVCKDVNFAVMQGERIALTGKNGCGKSSVLKLICGENIKYTGEIFQAGGLIISVVPQSTEGLAGTLREYARESMVDETLFMTILRKMDFPRDQFDKRIENYSEGQKKKVLLAASLGKQAHVYIWDEPLNYIDVLSKIQIEQLILEYEPTLIFVEHDSTFTSNIATRVIEIGV